MTTPEGSSFSQNPEDRLAELLPLIAEDFTPQEGYSLDLAEVPLSRLEPGVDYRRVFQTLLDVPITDDASFTYTYDSRTGSIGLQSIRFGLSQPLKAGSHIKADGLYVQRCEDGSFVRSYGLGADTLAKGTEARYLTDAELTDFKILLSLTGLLELGEGGNPLPTAHALERVGHWYVTESLTVPLTSNDPARLNEMVITRSRSMVPDGTALEDIPDSELQYMDPEALALDSITSEPRHAYSDDYTLTIRSITSHPGDENKRNIYEMSLVMAHDFTGPNSYVLTEKDYTSFVHPFVKNDVEVEINKDEVYQPDVRDLAFFAQVLDRQYSDTF